MGGVQRIDKAGTGGAHIDRSGSQRNAETVLDDGGYRGEGKISCARSHDNHVHIRGGFSVTCQQILNSSNA
ncbi:hypothetical protein D3C74_458910 [compost metagenome]